MKYLLAFILFLAGPCWAQMTLNPAVTQDNIDKTICVSGWTKTVRPGVPYTNYVKREFLRTAGLPDDPATMQLYELDHIVPLELGGHPYSYNNLQLQLWTGPDGARAKDAVETYLHRMVCARRITLSGAQQCIFNSWQQCRGLIAKGLLT